MLSGIADILSGMTTTEERIAKLERSTARWRFATVGMVGVLAVGFMAGQGLSSKALTDLEMVMLDAMQAGAEARVVSITQPSLGRLVRVWSNGTTEAMNAPTVSTGSGADQGTWDTETQMYYGGLPSGQLDGLYRWRPVIDAPHPDGP